MKALTQIRIFFIENVRTFRLAPVEMAIACYYFIISILGEHTDIKPSQDQIMIMPFALILAILCNKWFTTHKSRIIIIFPDASYCHFGGSIYKIGVPATYPTGLQPQSVC